MYFKLWRFVVALCFIASLIGHGFGQNRQMINYQGFLNQNGTPADGAFEMTFSIYDVATGGAPIFTETHASVQVNQGVFNVLLGSVEALASNVFTNGDERFLGLSVDGDAEMSPRFPFTSVAYAFKSAVADVALSGGGTGDGHSLDAADGDPVDAVFVDNDGRVGIGTSNPSEDVKLEVIGDTALSAVIRARSMGIEDTAKLQAEGRGEFGRGAIEVTAAHNGFVGTQINDGAARIILTGDSQAENPKSFVFNLHPGADILKLDVANDGSGGQLNGVMTWKTDGNVGIGTTNPDAKLEVSAAGSKPVISTFANGANAALNAVSTSNGGLAVNGVAVANSGIAGSFTIDNVANSNTALSAETRGTGSAAIFFTDNPNNNASVLFVQHINPDGIAGTFNGGVVIRGDISVLHDGGPPAANIVRNDRGGGVFVAKNSQGNDVAFVTNNNADAGFVAVTNIAGTTNLVSLSTTGAGNNQSGFISVRNAAGTQTAGINGQTGDVFGNTKSFLVPDPERSDRMIRYTSLEGPEAAIYVRGKARLQNGRASITFPDHFRAMVAASSITVSLTPRSLDSQGLAAVDVSENGMQVGELAQGTGNYVFDYVVYGVRKGFEDYEVYVVESEGTR